MEQEVKNGGGWNTFDLIKQLVVAALFEYLLLNWHIQKPLEQTRYNVVYNLNCTHDFISLKDGYFGQYFGFRKTFC